MNPRLYLCNLRISIMIRAFQMARHLSEITNSRVRIDRRLDEMLTVRDSGSTSRPSEIIEMVFPNFSLFGSNDLDYFSE